jgi:hypothetical protein
MRRVLALCLTASVVAFGFVLFAAPGGTASLDIVVPGTAGGPNNGGTAPVSTGVVLAGGQSVLVSGSGTVFLTTNNGFPNDPDGGNPGNSTGNSLVPNSPYGCLAARVGSGSWACIGSGPTELTGTGEIQLAVNDDFASPGVGYDDNSGQFNVVITVPRATITVGKVVTGVDPGVSYPVTVTCTTTPFPVGDVGTTADGSITLTDDDTQSSTVQIPAGGSKSVDVSWPVSGVENVTCHVSEDLSALPAGTSCDPSITPSDTVVLHDVSDEIDVSSASVVVTNHCVAVAPPLGVTPPTAAPAVTVAPSFTG